MAFKFNFQEIKGVVLELSIIFLEFHEKNHKKHRLARGWKIHKFVWRHLGMCLTLTWLKKSTVLTATHSFRSSPSGSMTARRKFPDGKTEQI